MKTQVDQEAQDILDALRRLRAAQRQAINQRKPQGGPVVTDSQIRDGVKRIRDGVKRIIDDLNNEKTNEAWDRAMKGL